MVAFAAPLAGRLTARYPASILGGIGLATLTLGWFCCCCTLPRPAGMWLGAWAFAASASVSSRRRTTLRRGGVASGIEGEIRVCLQYFFQAWGNRAPNTKYRDMLLHTATEEIGHIEMLATAVALNLEAAPASLQESAAASHPLVNAVMGGERPRHMVEGMLQKHLLSTGMAAFPGNSDGLPFDCSHIYASGNLAADMYANVAAESTGRVLAVRLYNVAHGEGMKDMLSFLIARDTMHQQQWLAVIEETGGANALPIPNSFDQSLEKREYSYMFFGTDVNGEPPPKGRFNSGRSIDGKGEFTSAQNKPLGEEPVLGPARPDSAAQREQMG